MSKVSFTPNTITYTAHGKQADKIKKSKVGVVVHQQYHIQTMLLHSKSIQMFIIILLNMIQAK
jgi:hypothetical protein